MNLKGEGKMFRIKHSVLYLFVLIILMGMSFGCASNRTLLKESEKIKSEKMELEDRIKMVVEECEQEKIALNQQCQRNEKFLEKEVNSLRNNNKQLIKDIKEKNSIIEEIKVREEDKILIVALPNQILFNNGSSKIKKKMEPVLKVLSKHIREYPDRLILIKGHTCNLPINNKTFASNWELSSLRATAVLRYFVDKEKLPPQQFSAMGMGEYHPKSLNNSEAGRMKNRRIEIIILSKELSKELMN